MRRSNRDVRAEGASPHCAPMSSIARADNPPRALRGGQPDYIGLSLLGATELGADCVIGVIGAANAPSRFLKRLP